MIQLPGSGSPSKIACLHSGFQERSRLRHRGAVGTVWALCGHAGGQRSEKVVQDMLCTTVHMWRRPVKDTDEGLKVVNQVPAAKSLPGLLFGHKTLQQDLHQMLHVGHKLGIQLCH